MIYSYKRKNTIIDVLSFCFIFLNVLFITVTDFQSLYSYLYTFLLFVIINKVIKAEIFFLRNLLVLNFFIFLSILLYWGHYLIMPDSFGFSGMYGGIGTDDSRFFAGVASSDVNIPWYGMGYIGMDHSFVKFLKILYPFKIVHPLTILIPNILGICFIPHFTSKLTNLLTKDIKIAKTAYTLVLFCPVLLSNSLILMRDGWVAFFTLIGVYYLIKNKFLNFIISLCLLFFVRPGSGLLLLCASMFYFNKSYLKGATINIIPKVLFLLLGLGMVTFLLLPFISEYLLEKGFEGLDRQSFVESIIKEADEGSIIYKIYSLPIYLKVPLGFIFFIFLPFFRVEFYTLGVLNIRSIMYTMLMPILSLFYFKYFFKGIIHFFKIKNEDMTRFFYMFCFCILMISQVSIQPRHKTGLMPFFYIFVAYGYHKGTPISKAIGSALFVFLFLIQFVLEFF